MTSVTESLTIGQALTREQVNALPVGARVKWHSSEQRWERRSDGWYRVVSATGTPCDVRVFDHPHDWARTGNVLDRLPSTDGLVIEGRSYVVGDHVTSRSVLVALPVGTQIRHTFSAVIRTRTGDGWRTEGGAILSPTSTTISLINTVIHALPTPAPVAAAPRSAVAVGRMVDGHMVEVGGRMVDRRMQAAMPIGTVIYNSEVSRRRTRVADGWLREDTGTTCPADSHDIGLLSNVVESLPDVESAPAITPTTITVEGVTFTVGVSIGSSNAYLLPVGSVIRYNGASTYTKVAPNRWEREGRPREPYQDENFHSDLNVLVSLPPSVTEALPSWMVVGVRVDTQDRFVELPVGTVVEVRYRDPRNSGNGTTWTKRDDRQWESSAGRIVSERDGLASDCNYIQSLPGQPAIPEWMVVGHRMTTVEEYNALPVGSVVTWERDNRERNRSYVKEVGNRWRNEEGESGTAGSHFSMTGGIRNVLTSIGPATETPTNPSWMVVGQNLVRPDRVQQMREMPVGSKITYQGTQGSPTALYRKVQNDRWVLDTDADDSRSYCSSSGFNFHSSITTIAHLPVQEGTTVTATTLDLESVPIGGTLTTTETGRPTTWTRTDVGFINSATPLAVPIDYFSGIVASGMATVGAAHSLNDVWQDGSYFYLIYHVDAEGRQPLRTVTYVVRDGIPVFQSYNQFQRDVGFGQKVTAPPTWTIYALEQARQYHAQVMRVAAPAPAPVVDQSQVDRLQRELTHANTRYEGFRSGVVRMAEAMVETLESNSIDWGQVDSEMESLGLPCRERDDEEIDITIDVSGRTSVDVSDHLNVGGLIGGDATWDGDTSEATIDVCWERSFTQTTSVTEGSCGCENVDHSDVERMLADAGVNYNSFDYENSCPNC